MWASFLVYPSLSPFFPLIPPTSLYSTLLGEPKNGTLSHFRSLIFKYLSTKVSQHLWTMQLYFEATNFHILTVIAKRLFKTSRLFMMVRTILTWRYDFVTGASFEMTDRKIEGFSVFWLQIIRFWRRKNFVRYGFLFPLVLYSRSLACKQDQIVRRHERWD